MFAEESNFRNALVAQVQACADYWRAKGVDRASFTTAASADDLDDFRQAMGSAKLSLPAHSYGTSLALDAVKRHGEHLDRVVLAAVEGRDRALAMPLVFDFGLRRISEMAANSPKVRDAFPDTYGEFQRVLNQAGREPSYSPA